MTRNDEFSGSEIAVVGMACKFPEAASPEEFWQNICDGKESLARFSREELLESGVPEELINDPEYVPVRGIIEDEDKFDAEFFGYNPAEAAYMDPQQRIFLQIAWEALESAGYNPAELEPLTGLFAGVGYASYLNSQLASLNKSKNSSEKYQILIGNDKDFLATRVAYKLGLKGPVITLQTACSTSLVASHMACQSLLNGECDMALAGGVTIVVPQKQGYLYQEGMILSPDGCCRAFDSKAKGTVTGNGAGIVLLKRLEDAIEDNDPIIAVIRGSAINNDGSQKIGYTAPGPAGQKSVIREALSIAEVDADSIGYVETHGTGTVLGDPIEIDALTEAYRSETERKLFCAIGSVKSNIGHLDTAAGVASLMKTALMLKNKALTPQVHFTAPNPEIDFENSPFYVNDRLANWETNGSPRRAGVSSFGIGGTNAHLVLEEFEDTEQESAASNDNPKVLLLSGNREDTISRYSGRLADFLINHPNTNFYDVLFTINTSRKWLKYRKAFVAKDLPELHRELQEFAKNGSSGDVACSKTSEQTNDLVFMFTGQGSQYINMGKELYGSFPLFKEKFDQCVALFENELHFSLHEIIYPEPETDAESENRINQTIYTQPALFCFEYALAQLLQSFDSKPSILIGHSIGEIVAATLAGVFSLENAVRLVSARCSLMQNLPVRGKMATVFQPFDVVSKKLEDFSESVSIAAVNAPGNVVISGDAKAVDLLVQQFTESGVKVQLLNVSHAFHSPLMEPMLKEFRLVAESIKYSKPSIPIVSNLSGEVATEEIATSGYWVNHVRQGVLFTEGIHTLLKSGQTTFIEIGPRAVLSTLGQMTASFYEMENESQISWISCMNPQKPDQKELLSAVGKLWSLGYEVDFSILDPDRRANRINLPTYPFAKDRHWYVSEPSKDSFALPRKKNRSSSVIGMNDSQQIIKEGRTLDKNIVMDDLRQELKNIAGITVGNDDLELNFFHLGIDSLMLVRVRQFIKKKYSVEIPMADFYDKVDNVNKLSSRVSEETKVEQVVMPMKDIMTPDHLRMLNVKDMNSSVEGNTLYEKVVSQQLNAMQQLMREQLEALSQIPQSRSPHIEEDDEEESVTEVPKHLSMFQHLGKEYFTDKQQKFLDEFIPLYIKKTAGSKAFIAENREGWSDWINAVNFRFALKEILYPIVAKRSKGSRFWDVDDNEYLDLAMGYGVNFLGHNPEIVSNAIQEQLNDGFQLGPQFHLTGEVVQLIRKLTGVDRVAFTNTGTEAIMAAVRIARTVTHRKTIVVFSGSYHGWYDGVLVTPDGDKTMPAFRGINKGMVEDVVMLHYGDESALEKIRELGKSVAAILVEPVQSRRPGFHPKEFLHELRGVADDIGAALLFDEIITGFRIHPGGAQSHFGVKADMITYGKVIGGGMPVGIVSGSKKYMDALDGGQWSFGDSSYPTRDTTMFAGTFCKHPLTMRVMKNVLTFLIDQGPELQENLNKRTDNLVQRLNTYYKEFNVPIRMRNFGSVFRFESFGKYDLVHNPIEMEIFFYLLNYQGIYTWERHVCFLSIQHSDEDVDKVVENVKSAIAKMRDGGFTFSTEDK